MKKLLLIFTLLLTIIFSATSFAEWQYTSNNIDGTEYYIDFEKIRKHDGYVYTWILSDLLKPDKDGDLSYLSYWQIDCKLFRIMVLQEIYYKGPMGNGSFTENNFQNPKWKFAPPDSAAEYNTKIICSR